MSKLTMQETLRQLMDKLKSGDAARQTEALRELGTLNFSSEAIVLQLERLALDDNADVRAAALDALNLKTSRFVAEKRSKETRSNRQLIVKEINAWEADGLVERHRAETLRRRYDFDMRPEPQSPPAPAASKTAEPEAPAAPEPAPRAPAAPPAPRPSLTQVLLSETSIKIFLYLGAFFVIAAAAILAALVEAARLPVLLVATAAFAAGAVIFKKRLPQPSFALAVVFSFLLPIDANVIADQLALTGVDGDVYWTFVYIVMAAAWAFGTFFYASRLFSLAAFLSLLLAAWRFGQIFDASAAWNVFFIAGANLVGLFGVFLLKKWKDFKFAQPAFLLAQAAQLALLASSFSLTIVAQFDPAPIPAHWIAAALTWILAASFFAASELLAPFVFFPWMAAASLFPLPWLVLSIFDAPILYYAAGFAVWGALTALAGEGFRWIGRPALTKYRFPFLALSLASFLAAVSLAFYDQNAAATFAVFLGAAVVYFIIHIARPRWYAWMTALIFGLGAYFTFFTLPFVETLEVDSAYQLLGASLLLLIPELFARCGFSFSRVWSWPPILLGALLALFNIQLALLQSAQGKSALVLFVAALLAAAYALRFRQPLLGYFSAALGALTVIFVLRSLELDGWLPALTGLSVLYYAAGFLLAPREKTKPWGMMLVRSGLTLGALVSFAAAMSLEATGGWYALVVAALFVVEMFVRRQDYLEILVEVILSAAVFLILRDLRVTETSYTLFALSLLWLTCDMIFKLTFPARRLERLAKAAGALLAVAAAGLIATELSEFAAALCFGIYTLFFAVYTGLHKNAQMVYAPAVFLALTVHFGFRAVGFDAWLFPQIALAATYYAVGFVLRLFGRAGGWDSVLRFSGLGLGTFVALFAPIQAGGLERSVPIAIAATLYAAEAFARRNVWLGFPANGFYLMAYFVFLNGLKVDEPQFFSVGAAALGLLQHYLLRRAGQKSAAFFMGIVSQLVLLGTSYIQMTGTGELKYFFLLLFQFLAMLAYGIVVRSRSLIIAPIAIVVLAVLTVLYNALKNLSLVIIIGVTGIALLALGILAVVMRERIAAITERFSDWDA